MKRVLIFLVLLFGLVSIGLAMYGRSPRPEASYRYGSGSKNRQAFSQHGSRRTFTF